ncbi:hypothetical protein [Streptomyces boninensis]|uniref:hypothetical protein n=1 Tax=Streptomyces boninensis TaxID=2039455 RepID=UPI003B2249F4
MPSDPRDPDPPADEPEALTVLCGDLAALRRRAAEGLWTARLERVVQEVRDGGSAVEACTRLGLIGTVPRHERTGDDSPWPAGLGPEEPPLGKGSYACPRRTCERAGQRGDNGRPPFCMIYDLPMRPT